jgi:hypothetical protein
MMYLWTMLVLCRAAVGMLERGSEANRPARPTAKARPGPGVRCQSPERDGAAVSQFPDDGGHLVGTEGPHRARADIAERPYLEQTCRPRLIVGEVGNANEVVLADRPEQFAYPAA